MLVIAHRGANTEALENSFSAFDKSIDGGATRLEFDIQATADHLPIVIHDSSLQRTAGNVNRVSAFTAAELRSINLSNGEPIPMLSQVIERYLECDTPVELNIEVKDSCPLLASNIADLIKNHRNRDKIILSSFQWQALAEQMHRAPEIARACLWSADSFTWPFYANLAPQVFMERVNAKIIHPSVQLVDDNLMEMAETRGWQVYSWSGLKGEEDDREGIWSMLFSYNVNGHCTNYPREFRMWLDEIDLEVNKFQLTNNLR